MRKNRIKLLFIEDDEVDCIAFKRWKSGEYAAAYDCTIVSSFCEAEHLKDRCRFNLIVTDHDLGNKYSYDVMKIFEGTPVIVITRAGDEEIAVEVMKRGAVDYLCKDINADYLKTLHIRIEGALRKRADEERLRLQGKIILKNRNDMKSILNQLREITAVTDENGRIKFMNKAGIDLLELPEEDIIDKNWDEMFQMNAKDAKIIKDQFQKENCHRTKVHARVKTSSGKNYRMDFEITDDPRDKDGKIIVIYDMTDIYDLKIMLQGRTKFQDITGKSREMNSIFKIIEEVSAVDWTVLIEGETGTGKELVARAIHNLSDRNNKPFVAVNCAGLSESLLNSQLFGHRRGAFTGAVHDQQGVFEAAHGGTLFLDEIGDVSMNMQTSLLRVLESKEVTRIGDAVPKKINARILAATHRNINDDVKKGIFRADLMYRLRVARITLPPLRMRRDDIPLLAAGFLNDCRLITGKDVRDFSCRSMKKLLEYYWPGNVRELKSAIEFAMIRCAGSVIRSNDLPPEIRDDKCITFLKPEEEYDEKIRILSVLQKVRGNKVAASKRLGIGRSTLYRKIDEFEITL